MRTLGGAVGEWALVGTRGERALGGSLAARCNAIYMELLFQLRELLLKIQYCLIKVILIFNLQFIPY